MASTDADGGRSESGEAPPSLGLEAVDYDRYASVDLEDAVIVYDRREEDAWVQSDAAISVASVR